VYVIDHTVLPRQHCEGHHRLAAAHRRFGVTSLEMWVDTLEPGARSAPHRPLGQSVLVVMAGTGELTLNGVAHRFRAPCSLVVAAGTTYSVGNRGHRPVRLVSIHARAPRARSMA
jgi:quercetin dioxygenase-like cupin family protein